MEKFCRFKTDYRANYVEEQEKEKEEENTDNLFYAGKVAKDEKIIHGILMVDVPII